MKVSQIGLISRKLSNLDEQFPVQDMLIQTGQIDQFASGIYAYGHVPYLLKRNIERIIIDTLTKYRCSEISLPVLQPESIWIESGRLDKYVSDDAMFRALTNRGNYCLAPTAEEAVVSFARSRLTSYKHLPVTYFQIGQKFRNEIRSRGFLLRGKSFDMMDAYSFGRNQEDLNNEYESIKMAYIEIFENLGLNAQPVGADNGGFGGSKSEEFMLVSDIGEDNILFDEVSGKAFNSELLEREDYKEYLKDTYGIENTDSLITRKAVELGHIFQLGDKYAKSMNGTFTDEEGNQQNYVMGCYGIGVSRTLAMIYENSIIKTSDGKFDGISLPVNIAPYLLYIIPKSDDKEKLEQSLNIYNELINNNVGVLFDDREDMSIGAKIKDSKVVGTPYVAVFGKSLERGVIEVENNSNGNKVEIKLEDFVKYFTELQSKKKDKVKLESLIK